MKTAPGGPPLQIKATAVSSRSVRVTWKAPRKELQYGRIKGYYVGYRVFDLENESFIYKTLEGRQSSNHGYSPIYSSPIHSPIHSQSSHESTLTTDECHLTGLKRFTKYAIIVQAFNAKGTGPSSEIIEVQTLQNDPPAPPVLKVSSVTTSSIHLTWSVPGSTSDADQATVSSSDPIVGFILHQRKHHPGSDPSPGHVSTSSGHSSGHVSTTSGHVSTISGHVSTISGHVSTMSADWEEVRLPGDRSSHTFERLACGSKYQYFITGFNSVGKSDPSEILTTKTEGNTPVPPDKNSLLSVNTTAAHVFLDSWHDGACPITSFLILHKARKSNRSKWDSIRVFPASFKATDSDKLINQELITRKLINNQELITRKLINNQGSTNNGEKMNQESINGQKLINQELNEKLISGQKLINGQKLVVISDLLPSTMYDLKIIGMNEAGSTEVLYTFTTASMLKTSSGGAILGGNEAVHHGNNLVNLDLTLLLPTTISLVLVIIIIFLARICFIKKRRLDSNALYGGSSSVYEPTSKSGAESVCLTGLGPNCTLKNKNGTSNGHAHNNGSDSGSNYPNPYELTKLNGGDSSGLCNNHAIDTMRSQTVDTMRSQTVDTMRSQTTPLKPMMMIDGNEPMYATVKRTARNPRTGGADCHLYQYPCTINGTTGLVTITADSCCETDSCLSLNSSANGNNCPTTAFLRLHEPNDHLLPLHPFSAADHVMHCIND